MVNLPYTVVGVYPDDIETYVEFVEAESILEAVHKAQRMDEDRMDYAIVVAVFEGHMVDKLNA